MVNFLFFKGKKSILKGYLNEKKCWFNSLHVQILFIRSGVPKGRIEKPKSTLYVSKFV